MFVRAKQTVGDTGSLIYCVGGGLWHMEERKWSPESSVCLCLPKVNTQFWIVFTVCSRVFKNLCATNKNQHRISFLMLLHFCFHLHAALKLIPLLQSILPLCILCCDEQMCAANISVEFPIS